MTRAPTDEQYRAAAITKYGREGEIEIDDVPTISRGSDPGAYVQAWVWVYDSDAIEPELIEAVRESTHKEAFEKIQPNGDWRGLIDAHIEPGDFLACNNACIFYTATELTIKQTAVGDDRIRVVALGYRNGPAGS